MAKAKREKEEIENVNHLIMPNFVKYHPTLNIKTWLSNFELKCDSYNLDAQWRILHISDYMQDEALIYHYEILSNIGNWPEAKEKLINRFQKIKLTPLVEAIKVYQGEQETISDYYHRKMKMINLVELPSKSIVELLNEGILKKYKPYLATIDTDQPLNWLTMATKIEKSLTGSGTPVEKGHLQTSNPALHPAPRPAGYYGNSQVQRPPLPCRICERLGLELQWHYHSVCPYRNPTVSRSFPPATPRVLRPTASRSFPSATPHPYQAAASSTFPPPTPHDYQPTVANVGLINTIPITFRLTTDTPIVQKPYRTSYANNTEINRQIHELLKYNIIRPSCSAYASPILLVQNKSNITGRPTRLCIDFRKLNLITKTENSPIPLLEEILDRLGNAKMFASLDIKHAYWHIPIAETHKGKTAFVCQQGCYEWNRMPYGLKNGPRYTIKNGTYTPRNANIEAIKKLQRPYNMKTLQSFLGSINVYHKFIPHYAQIRAPLNTLLQKNSPWQ
ncbi:K02A2.6-like [Cordylochernes scorpioides]|uniref:K02A2.6-like n=1 Tax=Cordylochernes scorpioides TaxID=51811 RepID=A0ABY6LT09_9ARAC|nr:K02A2.6-like [Cordylochernes scorpioides]